MMSPTENIGIHVPFPYVDDSRMFISWHDLPCFSLQHLFDVIIHLLFLISHYSPANLSREFSASIGNVAWKERDDGWKMKGRNGVIPMTNSTSITSCEGRGAGDIDVSTEYNMEDALL
jgi:hypothetical protein